MSVDKLHFSEIKLFCIVSFLHVLFQVCVWPHQWVCEIGVYLLSGYTSHKPWWLLSTCE